MRIAYLCFDSGIPICGYKGASVHVRETALSLREAGHEVLLIAAKGNPSCIPQQILLDILPPNPFVNTLVSGFRNPEGGFRLSREVEQIVGPIACQAHVARVLERFKPDALYERYTLFGWSGVELAREMGLPLLLEVNAPLSEEAAVWRGLRLREIAAQIEAQVLKEASVRIVVSEALRQHVVKLVGDSHQTVVLPNGVDVSRFSPMISDDWCRNQYRLTALFVVGYVGGFKLWQDLNTLLRGFADFASEVQNAHLLLVGEGPSQSAVRDLSVKLGLENRVTFTGPVPHDQIPNLIAAMDIAVVPFIAQEGFYFSPLKMFEYMAMGKCILASRIGQIAEVIEDRRSGWLFNPEDALQLGTGLTQLYHSPALRRELGEQAREVVVSHYTWQHNAARITELLQSVVGH